MRIMRIFAEKYFFLLNVKLIEGKSCWSLVEKICIFFKSIFLKHSKNIHLKSSHSKKKLKKNNPQNVKQDSLSKKPFLKKSLVNQQKP